MELFENARSVRLKSHLGTYLCAADDAEAVSHGYRRNSRGTVWAVEPAGDEYVRIQGQRGLYLGAADPTAALDAATPSCRVVQGVPSTPNDSAFLWTPRRERGAGCLTLSGPLGRLLRASFGETPRDNAVTLDFDVGPEESAWVVEAVPAEQAARPPPCRAQSCDARMQATAATTSDTASSSFIRFYSTKEPKTKLEEPPPTEEPLHMPARRTIFHNTAREDGAVDDFDEGTWRYFTFDEQSLSALSRRLQEETKHKDFVICRRSAGGDAPRLFPVVLDLPPGNDEMEFVLVLVPSTGALLLLLIKNILGTYANVVHHL
ncbi:Actin cross-linking protein [Zea mays]|uniref:Actin cross-linking protein n=1 Tax=Zea mays TaxID=4577 RepID=A0A1D6M7N1_MAIZE|nr:Actin cross-linking protein [Zea mays]